MASIALLCGFRLLLECRECGGGEDGAGGRRMNVCQRVASGARRVRQLRLAFETFGRCDFVDMYTSNMNPERSEVFKYPVMFRKG